MPEVKIKDICVCDVAVLYGQRPCDKRVWYLSPYEVESEWEWKLLSYPQYFHDVHNQTNRVELTREGLAKLHSRQPYAPTPDLHPGHAYVVRGGDHDWMPFPKLPSTEHFRST